MQEFGISKNTLRITRAIRLEFPNVLVADDDPANRLLAIKFLEKLGCKVDSVSSADDAVEAIKSEAFDLVLMDCSMPGKSGFDATREIRAYEGDKLKIPIFAFTASRETEVLKEYLAAGMTGYLRKPIEIDVLHRLIETMREQAEDEA